MENIGIFGSVWIYAVPAGIALVIAVYFIYRAVYDRHATKAIDEEADVKPMLAPFWVTIITAVLAVAVTIGIAAVIDNEDRNSPNVIHYSTDDTGRLVDVWSQGAMKSTSRQGDYASYQVFATSEQLVANVNISDPESVAAVVVYENGTKTVMEYDHEKYGTNIIPLFVNLTGPEEEVKISVTLTDGSEADLQTVNPAS